MRHVTRFSILVLLSSILFPALPADAGDMFWSPVPELSSVNDFAVCGTTVYAATANGLFRSDGDPETWDQIRPAYTGLVACSGSRVIWEEAAGVSSVVYVTDDAFQTVTAANGLDDAISRGIRDLAISGMTALVATLWGVDRSTDGGFNFPSAYPVLWESSAGYQITAVWTNGTACAAAGSGGSVANGVWRSVSGVAGTWTLVLDTGGQSWLDGWGADSIVSGNLYGGASDPGYISTDAGATWSVLPLSWGAVAGHYQKPFLSAGRILSRHVDDIFDPGSGQFITMTDGPLLYDTATGVGNDLDPSLASENEIFNQAIVETADPFMLIAERSGVVYWFRIPGGWPAGDLDFTPPYSPSINVSPRVGSTGATSVTVHPGAVDAVWMYIEEEIDTLSLTYDVNGFGGTLSSHAGGTTGGWVDYSTSQAWSSNPEEGLHIFFAWYADASGNITDPAVYTGTTIFPATLTLGSGGVWGAWLYAVAGESFTIGAAAGPGDVDIHHWEPSSFTSDDWAATIDVNDTLTFTARETGFHLVVLLNYPGAATFSGAVTATSSKGTVVTAPRDDRPAEQSSTETVDETPPPYYTSNEAARIFSDSFESGNDSNWSVSVP